MKQAVVLLLLIGYAKARITCRGLNGEPVDWFVVYKPPTSSRSPSQFYYADGDRSNWTLGPLPITATTTAVGATLGEFYESNKKNFIFAYNDDSPTGKVDSYRGHSKGVTVFDEDTGFWLIHSVPNFPSLGSYSYPATGIKFGQTFLCLSLPTRFLGDVGEHLRYLQATPFFYNLPNQFSERYPVLVNIVKKQSIPKSTTHFTRVAQLSTIRGMPLRSFSKHKKFNKDLWFDLVGPELGTNLAVESWLNGGADDLESICTRGISIYDVSVVGLPDISFNSSRDHSKWAVADTNGRTSIVCVGDLNRQKSQFGRGGGAVCFQHHGLWTTFHNSVKSVQPCGRKNIHSYLNYVLPTVLSIVVLSTLRFTVP
ncbi:hypothetical protein V3C99_005849 [Haemonchus contortus]|nr:Deoxyribonuclease II domain containing protein [Haemonchus contortus]